MVDIDTEIQNIMEASRGETVRDAIVSALKKLYGGLVPPTPNDD